VGRLFLGAGTLPAARGIGRGTPGREVFEAVNEKEFTTETRMFHAKERKGRKELNRKDRKGDAKAAKNYTFS
jgi:hypothetical protein